MKGVSAVKYWTDGYDALEAGLSDLETLLDFGEDAADDLDAAFKDLVEKLEALEMRNMLGAEGDNLGAVLTINSGAGGTEANDWSSMLMRMYTRWGERNGYKMTVTELLEGDEAGIKSCTIQFEGDYGRLLTKTEIQFLLNT